MLFELARTRIYLQLLRHWITWGGVQVGLGRRTRPTTFPSGKTSSLMEKRKLPGARLYNRRASMATARVHVSLFTRSRGSLPSIPTDTDSLLLVWNSRRQDVGGRSNQIWSEAQTWCLVRQEQKVMYKVTQLLFLGFLLVLMMETYSRFCRIKPPAPCRVFEEEVF